MTHLRVRHDVLIRKARVDLWLKDLDFLTRNLGASQASDQFLRFAREHRAGDNFNPASAIARLWWWFIVINLRNQFIHSVSSPSLCVIDFGIIKRRERGD